MSVVNGHSKETFSFSSRTIVFSFFNFISPPLFFSPALQPGGDSETWKKYYIFFEK